MDNMENGELRISNNDWFFKVVEDLEAYTKQCENSFDDEDEDLPFGTLSGEEFCGCERCYSREQLFFLAPRIIEAYKKGFISIGDV